MRTFDERKKSVEAYMTRIRKQRHRTIATVTSVCLVLCIFAAAMLLPIGGRNDAQSHLRIYKYSDYYPLICSLDRITSDRQDTGFPMPGGVASGDLFLDAAPMPSAPNAGINAPTAAPDNGENQYEEVTDNQVEGVIEGDIFKRSTQYVYYLRNSILSVYSIAGDQSQQVGSYQILVTQSEEEEADWGKFQYGNVLEMYLSEDCSTITVVMQTYYYGKGTFTHLLTLDVSDPEKITETNWVYFAGRYVSSRMVDGQILLTCNYNITPGTIDYSDPSTYVPQYGTYGDMELIPGDQIVCTDHTDETRYTTLAKVDAKTLEVVDTAALLGYSQELYVSRDTIFTTNVYSDKQEYEDGSGYRRCDVTEITGISYAGEGLQILGTVTVEGQLKDQYSMDQYEGVLRVVASTRSVCYTGTPTRTTVKRNVNLYCIDLSSWKIAAEVIGFAPEGEAARSVRFDGVHAYVCTAEVITLTDPVYFFDLSDLHNITWTDTGTIDGYSTSLIQMGNGYLLGIGYGNNWNLKIEVYAQQDNKVISVCAYERDANFSTSYKSYLVDREHGLIGLSVQDWNGESAYLLLHFDGYALNELVVIDDFFGWADLTRAFIAEGFLYVLGNGTQEMYVRPLW